MTAVTVAAAASLAHMSHETLVWTLGAGVAVFVVVAWLAQRVPTPYPVFLVLAGVALGFVPGVPDIRLNPDVVFIAVLPPLIYASAYFTSLNEFRANIRPITLLAFGLVVFTTLTVAVMAHHLIGLGWAEAFVLGAIVSPTDPVAGSAVLERLSVPRRIVHIVEGESLINDGSGIVLYRVAVAAVVTGSFSLSQAGVAFVVSCVGGVLVGLVVGAVVAKLRMYNQHGATDVLLSMSAGYLAYLPAEAMHVSGVLSVAACSVWLGWLTPDIVRDARTRVQLEAVWETTSFLLNVALFLLVGIQMRGIVERLDTVAPDTLVWWSMVMGVTVMVTRFAWVYPATWLPRAVSRRVRMRDPMPNWRAVTLLSWIGMRGAVSLAAALAVPLTVDGGGEFPHRDLIVFLTFGVIVFTLVVQGVTLAPMVRALGVRDDGSWERAVAFARSRAARAASERLEAMRGMPGVDSAFLDTLKSTLEVRVRSYDAIATQSEHAEKATRLTAKATWLFQELRDAQRAELRRLRDTHEITDEVMDSVARDLDLLDMRS